MRKEGEGKFILVGTLLALIVLVLGIVSVGSVWSVVLLAKSPDAVSSLPAPITELLTPTLVPQASVTVVQPNTPTEIVALVEPAPTASVRVEPAPTVATPVPSVTPSPIAQATALPGPQPPTPTLVSFAVERVPTPTMGQTSVSVPQGIIVSDTFDDPASGWPVRKRETWSAQYVDGHYEMTLSGQPSSGSSTVFAADQYRLSADITVFQGRAGLIFLSTPPAAFYRLMISPDGSYSIETTTEGSDTPTMLVPPTASSALQRGVGVSNHITVERHDQTIQFFVNDQPLTTWNIPPGEHTNQYGFAIASPFGKARAVFDTIVGERLSS